MLRVGLLCRRQLSFRAIVVCAALHNLMRIEHDELLLQERHPEFEDAYDPDALDRLVSDATGCRRTEANMWREGIADRMWGQYYSFVSNRRRNQTADARALRSRMQRQNEQ